MMELSTMITTRVGEAHELCALSRRSIPVLIAGLAPLDGRHGFELEAHLGALLHSQCDWLESLTRSMQEAEQRYVDEQDDDMVLRGRMGEASIVLDRKLRLTREHLLSAEGANALQIYGMSKRPPRARGALVSYARNAIDLLSAHPHTFKSVEGEALETRTIAVMLNDLLTPFGALVAQMDDEVDDLQHALGVRNEAVDRWMEIYCGVARTLEGLARMAGQHELVEECLVLLGGYSSLRQLRIPDSSSHSPQ